MHILANGVPNEGNCRETFFYNQMKVRNEVIASKESDFSIRDYTFEIGGGRRGKNRLKMFQMDI